MSEKFDQSIKTLQEEWLALQATVKKLEEDNVLLKLEMEHKEREVEKYRSENEEQKINIPARNDLRSYCVTIRSAMEEENVIETIEDYERESILDKCDELLTWLDPPIEEYDHRQTDIEEMWNPLISQLYPGAGDSMGGIPDYPSTGGEPPGAGDSMGGIPDYPSTGGEPPAGGSGATI